ncbi:MAG: alkaline phosphatase family protein, partial [Acidobacteriota bacterium]|nr:alkaline phosphatase family protein [Acidobacteriota bacterium]
MNLKIERNTPVKRAMAGLALAALVSSLAPHAAVAATAPAGPATTTPIQHMVIIFQENVSFDHYFATYPVAANPAGEPVFTAAAGTPSVNGLSAGLLTSNPNSVQPFRLGRNQAYTCDQNHEYTAEQAAFDGGLMDKFVESVGVGAGSCPDYGKGAGLTMGYYDGNTVTAMWSYAQHFAMSDNHFDTTFGPSTPGVINLVSGQTARLDRNHTTGSLTGAVSGNSVTGDPDPYWDDCGHPTQISLKSRNIGDVLNAAGLTWGWFQGGFAPSSRKPDGTAVCAAATHNLAGASVNDYSAHHEPFQYWLSTANPHHLPPSSVAMIGHTDQANHQYDLTDFQNALNAGNLPAVTYLKAKKSQDGHAGYSSPLDEQIFLVNILNQLQKSKQWSSTAVFIAWDDSDGWYDHVMPPIMNGSQTSDDALNGT